MRTLASILMVMSCAGHDDSVATNSLGITSLEVDRSPVASNGDRSFDVRGIDAAGTVIASMHYRIGSIEDLSERGTQIDWNVDGATDRMTTRAIAPRETRLAGKTIAFGSIPEVRSLVKRELGLELFLPPQRSEVGYYLDTCLNTGELRDDGPYARSCCRDLWSGATAWVTFRRESDNAVQVRYFGGSFGVCKMYNGDTNCAGPNNGLGLPVCDYGPCGSTAAQSQSGPYIIYVPPFPSGGGDYCGYDSTGPDWNSGGTSGSCPYRTCDNGNPVTGGSGAGWFDANW